ncbi:MAG: NERD domain-containing protein [Muribaculaceae bacterium]|nr:NERD domain-containing protein [Muribaculaceae bacterium]
MNIGIIIGLVVGVLAVLTFLLIKNWWNNGKRRRKGKMGERQVSKLLRSLKKKDYIVINDLLLSSPNGKSIQIDHVVVSNRGIFVIETKSHAGRITGGEHSQNWQQHFSSGSKNFYNPLLQNAAHIRILRRILPDVDENLFISMIAFTEAWRIEIKADDIVEERRFIP